MNNLSKQEQTEARFQYAERENCRMKSNVTIVVYGSSTGTCEAIAEKIAQKLGCEVINVQDLTADVVNSNQNLILGTMLGYDLCAQSERYCERCKKRKA